MLVNQLRHLVQLARRPCITVQVVPLSAGPHPGLEGPFVLMDFDAEPSMTYIENRAQSIFIEGDEVAGYALAWKRVLDLALPPNRSVQLLGKMAAELDERGREQP